MNGLQTHPYIWGETDRGNDPLVRFLPSFPSGCATGWLTNDLKLDGGQWVMDPFGTTPFLPLELASRGFSVLMVCNNPIIDFMTRVLASAPAASQFEAALSEISKIHRGDEWLDQHLKGLYKTRCPDCHQIATAVTYTWEKDAPKPVSCSYICPSCNAEGEKPFDEEDEKVLSQIGNDHLHRARAVQRVTGFNSDIQDKVTQILEQYLTRPLYFITTLINKLEGTSIPADRKTLLDALILSICDQGNTLWAQSNIRSRPKQLQTPTTFKEFNLWLAMEAAINFWTRQEKNIPCTTYPNIPEGRNGICLVPNRLIHVSSLEKAVQPQAAVCLFPRTNQALWALSAVWSGWLWGKEAVKPMKSVLERKRYDWAWLDQALLGGMKHLNHIIPEQTPVFGIIPETDTGFITAVLHALSATGFNLESGAMDGDEEMLQTWWKSSHLPAPLPSTRLETVFQQNHDLFLSSVNEPVSYVKLYTSALLEACHQKSLGDLKIPAHVSTIKYIQTLFDHSITANRQIERFNKGSSNLENNEWGRVNISTTGSLSDQVEMEIVNYLIKHPEAAYNDIQNHLLMSFPGMLTPSKALILHCLDSYAEEVTDLSAETVKWQLHSRELPANRRSDIQVMQRLLYKFGQQFDLDVRGENPIFWSNKVTHHQFSFHIMASSIISKVLLEAPQENRQRYIVIPGSRSRLLSYKLDKNPQLRRSVENGAWKFIKFRHLHFLSQKTSLVLDSWLDLINLDPPVWQDIIQMDIFTDPGKDDLF